MRAVLIAAVGGCTTADLPAGMGGGPPVERGVDAGPNDAGFVEGDTDAGAPATDAGVARIADAGQLEDADLGGRPVNVYIPASYSANIAAPLIVLLHGLTATGALQELYLQLRPIAERRGIIYALPDGTVDRFGVRFWNATDACCDNTRTGVDDSGYLLRVVRAVKRRWNVDAKRVFLVGHSNGGYMSYRFACDHAEEVAALVSLAGATWLDSSRCRPSAPVSVLQIHGTADSLVRYDGVAGRHPSANGTVEEWARTNGCSLAPDRSLPNRDYEAVLIGDETRVTRYADGCRGGSVAELWTIQGGGHIPNVTGAFREAVVDFLLAHPKE